MSLVPISVERHRELRWSPFTNYGFARKTTVAPLVLAELSRAVLSMPIGFVRRNDVVQPVALLGFRPEENLFVDADGRWLGPYVPAAFRGYPFRLMAVEADNRLVLCVDEGSGLVGPNESEAFFGPDGHPTERVRKVLDFLTQVAADYETTLRATAALDQAQLLVPWPLEVREEGKTRKVEGLLRVDEQALQKLDGAALASLRDAKALALGYISLLSMQHVAVLGELAKRKQAEEAKLRSVFADSFAPSAANEDMTFDWSTLPEPPTRQ